MVAFGLGMSAYLLITVLWMQNVWHWPVITTGFALAPAPAMVPIVTVLAQRLARKIPAHLAFVHGWWTIAAVELAAAAACLGIVTRRRQAQERNPARTERNAA